MRSQFVKKLELGCQSWNEWRNQSPDTVIDLSRAVLTGMNLSGYNLSKCWFVATDFIDTNLENADLSNADCRRARFIAANLKRTKFDFAVLDGADFLTAVVSQTSLKGLDLTSINLTSFDLKNTCLDKTNLQAVDLSGFNLSGSSLKQANLTSAKLMGVNLSKADLTGAVLEKTCFDKANLKTCKLANVKAMSASFIKVQASQANFIGADLRNSDFTSANLDGADLSQSLLAGVNTKLWTIKKIHCKSCSWDQKGKEFDRFKRGNFERLYGDRLSLTIVYPNCIQLQELTTLPFLIEHLAATKWGCLIQLQSITHLPGKSKVILSVTETGEFDPSELLNSLQLEIEQLQVAQMELRHNLKLQKDLKASLSSLKEQYWPRMLELAAEHQAHQQRQLTVLFMDLKGFSKWSESEMSGRLELFRGLLKPVLNRWQAVYPNMEGDSLRATFYNSSIAVECALMIQRVLTAAGFHLRIGIDVGPVQISHNDVTGISDLGGTALNFAARLETLAEPGDVLVTERVRHFARTIASKVFFKSQTVTLNKAVGDLDVGDEICCYRVIEN